MRAVIQKVNKAAVTIEQKVIASINKGLVILVGVFKQDTPADAQRLAQKVVELRLFEDSSGKMNLSAQDVKAQLLVVSQFTLCADTNSGRRPSFDCAQVPQSAQKLYLEFIRHMESFGLAVEQGVFQAYMTVQIENSGPVTFVLDSKKE